MSVIAPDKCDDRVAIASRSARDHLAQQCTQRSCVIDRAMLIATGGASRSTSASAVQDGSAVTQQVHVCTPISVMGRAAGRTRPDEARRLQVGIDRFTGAACPAERTPAVCRSETAPIVTQEACERLRQIRQPRGERNVITARRATPASCAGASTAAGAVGDAEGCGTGQSEQRRSAGDMSMMPCDASPSAPLRAAKHQSRGDGRRRTMRDSAPDCRCVDVGFVVWHERRHPVAPSDAVRQRLRDHARSILS